MTFEEILMQAHELLERQGRVSYRALKRRFELDDDYLEDLKAELIDAQRVAADEDGKVLVWTGGSGTASGSTSAATGPSALVHPHPSRREDPQLPRGHRGRAQAGHGAVRRPEGVDGAPR